MASSILAFFITKPSMSMTSVWTVFWQFPEEIGPRNGCGCFQIKQKSKHQISVKTFQEWRILRPLGLTTTKHPFFTIIYQRLQFWPNFEAEWQQNSQNCQKVWYRSPPRSFETATFVKFYNDFIVQEQPLEPLGQPLCTVKFTVQAEIDTPEAKNGKTFRPQRRSHPEKS
jgi:hypothetical protein